MTEQGRTPDGDSPPDNPFNDTYQQSEPKLDPELLAMNQKMQDSLIAKGHTPRRTETMGGSQWSWDHAVPRVLNWPEAFITVGLMGFVLGLLLILRS